MEAYGGISSVLVFKFENTGSVGLLRLQPSARLAPGQPTGWPQSSGWQYTSESLGIPVPGLFPLPPRLRRGGAAGLSGTQIAQARRGASIMALRDSAQTNGHAAPPPAVPALHDRRTCKAQRPDRPTTGPPHNALAPL
jgi:hypothetical protein